MKNGKISGLYVILDPSFLEGISEVEAAEAMIRGGARVIQWRDKTRDKGEQLPNRQGSQSSSVRRPVLPR